MTEGKLKTCSFCLKDQMQVNMLIDGGDSVFICNECVELCADAIYAEKKENGLEKGARNKKRKILFPKDIYKILNEYIVGQEEAKKIISVGLYNHYKRLESLDKNKLKNQDIQIDKSNILLVGPTGSGKTLIAKTIAKILDVPFAIADATSLTEAGYVGDDVETVLLRLLNAANNNVRLAERGIIYIDEVDKIASSRASYSSMARDVSGEGVQQALLKIMEGTIALVGKKGPQQEFFQMDTTHILFIFGGSFTGIEKIIEQRISQAGIGFGSKIKNPDDKQEYKKLMGQLEIADLIKFGMIPEFIGRLPVIATLQDPNHEELIKILNEPKNALTKQYKAMLAHDNINLDFSKESLSIIAQKALDKKVGARGLKSIVDDLFLDTIFNIQKDDAGSTLKVLTQEQDNQKLLTIAKLPAQKAPTDTPSNKLKKTTQ